MNRKNLTAAVLAGLAGVAGIAGTAQAVNINPDGTGQVLLYPYYTTNDGNQTLISVVNTTEQAKAVKVRFLEGFNSREVLDFNLYMSREDVWTAVVADSSAFGAEAGVPHLFTADTTCTVPYLYEMGSTAPGLQAFLSFAYTGNAEDGGPTEIGRAGEGHLEMIEMGTLLGDAAADATHGTDGMPADCLAINERWYEVVGGTDGTWFDEATNGCGSADADGQACTDTGRNSGGLFGGAAIVNADNGTMYSYDAKAIQGFDDTDDGLHYLPGTIFPSLQSGSGKDAWVFFGVPQNQAVEVNYDNSVDALSAVFMHDYIMNEYVVEEDLNAGTEWVITFPTKNFYADADRMVAAGLIPKAPKEPADAVPPGYTCTEIKTGDDAGKFEDCEANARAPFTQLFGANDDGDPLCEIVGLKTWDREEDTFQRPDVPSVVIPPTVSPAPPRDCIPGVDDECTSETVFQLCNEVNVLRFGEQVVFGTPDFDGESLLLEVTDEFAAGWGRINFTYTGEFDTNDDPVMRTLPANNLQGVSLVGLPVTGFSAYEFENDFAEGGDVKAYYGGLFGHKASVRGLGPIATPVSQ